MKLLNNLKNEISETLSALISLSFNPRTCLNPLKLTRIIPVLKKGDQQEWNYYRSISGLLNIDKF